MEIEIDLIRLIINTSMFLFFSIGDMVFNTSNIVNVLSNPGYCDTIEIIFNSILFVISFFIVIYSIMTIILYFIGNTFMIIKCHKIIWMLTIAKNIIYMYFILSGSIMFVSKICFYHLSIYFIFIIFSFFILPLFFYSLIKK